MVDGQRRRVTLRTIADLAGVHPSTASRVLRGQPVRIADAKAERIRTLARDLSYEPDVTALGLRTRRTLAIGIVMPRLTDMVLSLMVEGASERARNCGYQAITTSTRDRDDDQQSLVESLLDRRVDGLILGTVAIDDPLVDDLSRRGVPFVLINRRSGNHPAVTGDDELGGYLAARHLLDLGHTRIGIIAGPPKVSTAALRLAGYRKALNEAGIAADESLVVHSLFGIESGVHATHELLSRRNPPTAIFAVNDFAAIGAMGVLREHNLRVPQDMSVVGFNGVLIAARLPVSLTTVALPLEEMGQIAVDTLINQLEGRPVESVVLQPRLQVGASTGPVPSPLPSS